MATKTSFVILCNNANLYIYYFLLKIEFYFVAFQNDSLNYLDAATCFQKSCYERLPS